MAGSAHVAILMGTCNGARFLRAQLDTIAAQSHRDWRLVASDDGSTDATRGDPRGVPRPSTAPSGSRSAQGPRRGFAANYLGLAGDPGIARRLLRLRRPGRPLAP